MVDFVFYILSLPVATVAKLQTQTDSPIENIYKSFSNLDQTYLQPSDYRKDTLLNPVSHAHFPLLPTPAVMPCVYQCCHHHKLKHCFLYPYTRAVTDMYDVVHCPGCDKKMKSYVQFIKGKPDTPHPDYVKGNVSYMITDDLSVTPMSSTCVFSIMNKFNVSKLDDLQEKDVLFGNNEALQLLKSIFTSNDVLTRVFLSQTTTVEGSSESERMYFRGSGSSQPARGEWDFYHGNNFMGPD